MARISTGEDCGRSWIYRHTVLVRLTHWINAGVLLVLLISGLQIFNAHPALYWGQQSTFDAPWLKIAASDDEKTGLTTLMGRTISTTGFLGLSKTAAGEAEQRAFPRWLTLPGDQNLALGRKWHLLFAWLLVLNGMLYLLHGLLSRHFWRDMRPSGPDWRHIPRSIWDHMRLKFPKGDEARRYNVLQKLTYLSVIFLIVPLIVLTGMTMSPGLDAGFPWLLSIFGGRQSARTIHFLAVAALVLFVVVHVVETLISGVVNNIRSMITGRYKIESEVHDLPAEPRP